MRAAQRPVGPDVVGVDAGRAGGRAGRGHGGEGARDDHVGRAAQAHPAVDLVERRGEVGEPARAHDDLGDARTAGRGRDARVGRGRGGGPGRELRDAQRRARASTAPGHDRRLEDARDRAARARRGREPRGEARAPALAAALRVGGPDRRAPRAPAVPGLGEGDGVGRGAGDGGALAGTAYSIPVYHGETRGG